MKVIRRDSDGIIMPYNPIMAERKDVTVIENYVAGMVTVDPKAQPAPAPEVAVDAPDSAEPEPETPNPTDSDDAQPPLDLGVLDGLDS